MQLDLVTHIVAGTVGTVAGFGALYTAKGQFLHRKTGVAFVYAMVVMGLVGAGMALFRDVAPESNIPAGVLTAYLVVTGYTTVRPAPVSARWLHAGLVLVAAGIGIAEFTLGLQALTSENAAMRWMVIPAWLFAGVALLACAGDVRAIRLHGLRGSARLTRHLWRLCFALALAVFSFFAQARMIPPAVRSKGLVLLPALVFATMFYWFWRVRIRRSFRWRSGDGMRSGVLNGPVGIGTTTPQ